MLVLLYVIFRHYFATLFCEFDEELCIAHTALKQHTDQICLMVKHPLEPILTSTEVLGVVHWQELPSLI